ncbi:MAG: hypothetical protein J2P46_04085 [Zavarzinella sp.]|nr:hypothetical protein [Zavarzinella sp.]
MAPFGFLDRPDAGASAAAEDIQRPAHFYRPLCQFTTLLADLLAYPR